MNNELLISQTITLALAWWLGLYLLARDATNPSMRFAGLGLTAYALALAADLLSNWALDTSTANTLLKLGWPMLLTAAIFWFGAILFLLPEDDRQRQLLENVVGRGLVPFAIVFYLIAAGSDQVFLVLDNILVEGPLYSFYAVLILLLLMVALVLTIRGFLFQERKRPSGVVLATTIFFGLGLAQLLYPLTDIPDWFLILGIGFDLALLGGAVAFLDAFQQGETMRSDFLRSFTLALLAALIFGGQVALAMAFSTGITYTMLFLLLVATLSAIVVVIFLDPIQAIFDSIVFGSQPRIRQIRADSRFMASTAARSREILEPESLEEPQFAQLTRRALSHMGHLPQLSASPLTRMAIIDARLEGLDGEGGTLERAAQLKLLLKDSIQRLRPDGEAEFGTTDEWRFYNALYFPYVVGLKPYSRRAEHHELDSINETALEWLRSQVPERTLYNWQKAAAALIAQDLREQNSALN